MSIMVVPRVLSLLCPLSTCPFIASLYSDFMAGISGQSRYLLMGLGSVCGLIYKSQVAESVTGYWSYLFEGKGPNANNSGYHGGEVWIVNFSPISTGGNDTNRNNNHYVRLVHCDL